MTHKNMQENSTCKRETKLLEGIGTRGNEISRSNSKKGESRYLNPTEGRFVEQ